MFAKYRFMRNIPSYRDPDGPMDKLTHIDTHGTARMVDVGDKQETAREARAEARVRMSEQTAYSSRPAGTGQAM